MAQFPSRLAVAAAFLALSLPAAAQQRSDSYTFLEAVKSQDGTKVTEFLNKPGQTIANVRDDRGDAAIHIVTRRRDMTYLRFLIARGASINLEDGNGNTPMNRKIGRAIWRPRHASRLPDASALIAHRNG